jgi:RNA polymerase sigma-70 factor (family 1)
VALSDAELILRWQQGDERSFEIIYKKYVLVLLAQAMRKTNDRVISEEIVQNTFITLYKHKNEAARIVSIGAWLYTILKNKILDHYKHEAVVRKHEDFYAARSSPGIYNMEARLEAKELEVLLLDIIEGLPSRCKEIFKLSRLEYLSNKEIASRLHISENTVEQHMRKALKILRSTLVTYDSELLMLAGLYILY